MSYFDENYRDYSAQNPPKKLEFYLDIVRKNATGKGSGSIFEIGVGKGLFLEHAHKAGFRVQGCDTNAEAIAETRSRLPDVSLFEGEFQEADGAGLQNVVAFDVAEHVLDVEALFRSVFVRLEEGGRFFFVCPVYDGPLGLVVRFLDKDPTHAHKRSRFWWLRLARATGFRVVEWRGVVRYLLPYKYYLHVEMRGPLKFIASAIVVVCAKS